MARDQVDRNAEKTSRWAAAIVVALVMGVSLGFIDVLKNMIGGIWDFPTFWSVWSTLAVRITGTGQAGVVNAAYSKNRRPFISGAAIDPGGADVDDMAAPISSLRFFFGNRVLG